MQQEETKTIETDVLVIGAGPAGMAAVAAARESGASVVAVEAQDRIGGNAIWSTGYVVFVDTPMQRAEGIEDDVEKFLEDAGLIADRSRGDFGVLYDEKLARIYGEESAETYRQLIKRGVRFPRFIHRPKQHQLDRVAAVEDTQMFATAYQSDFDSDDVTVFYRSSARRLLIGGDGAVVGAKITTDDGSSLNVVTRRGVVLCAGGYQANPDMRARYQPESRSTKPYLGIDTARGDGHLMGGAVGGDLINMTFIPSLVIVASSMLEESIAIDRQGRRFHDETGVYEDRVSAVLAQPDQWAYYVFDGVTAEKKAQYVEQMPDKAVSSETLEGLAELIGVPADQLVATVDEWNATLESGVDIDPLQGRVSFPADRRGIRTGPFFAGRMVAGCSFISGGFQVTTSMQVVDVFGDPIPGLFAAGDCVGGFNPCADLGGIHIGGGLTFGRIAGHAVAAGELAEPHTTSPLNRFLPSRVGTTMEIVHVES
jgi:fumarate reductase flavoprotein subunit